MKRLWKFCIRVVTAIKNVVKKAILDVVKHPEAVAILSLASVGLTVVLKEIPYRVACSAAVEALLGPELAVAGILILLSLMAWRII